MHIYYTIYKITNIINSKYYIGKHRTQNLYDKYMGSGIAIKKAIKKYGIENFTKEILYIFDNEQDMNNKEKELVVLNELSYNMCEGGKGGFNYINNNNLNVGANNIMVRSEEARKKVSLAIKTKRKSNKIYYDSISIKNLEKTRGVKKPNQSIYMKKRNVEFWKQNKERMRDVLSSTFLVISPNGSKYTTNRLEDFCNEYNLPYTTIWGSSVNKSKIITKGKAKGWSCQKI
jgi:hypothetical protein